MANSVELAFYEVGIRLTQYRELHRRAISGAAYGPNEVEVGADDVALAKWSLRKLNATFARLAGSVLLDVARRQACQALVQNCHRCWRRLSRIPLTDLHEDDELGREFGDDFNRLSERITEIAEGLDAEKVRSLSWFELGKSISDGSWCPPKDEKKRTKRVKLGIPGREIEVENTEAWEWHWFDSDEVQRLLAETATSEDTVFSVCTRDHETVRLLPYPADEYWPWYRLEAGLRKMGVLPEPDLVQQGKGAADETQPESPPLDRSCAAVDPAALMKMLKASFQIDVSRRGVIFQGVWYDLKTEKATLFLNKLVDSLGDWLGPREYPPKTRPDRIMRDIPPRIRDLIEVEGAKGSRIPINTLVTRLSQKTA